MPISIQNPHIVRRKKLHKFLQDELILIQKDMASPEVKVHESMLRIAIEGLEALEYGEVQPIFVPRKTKDQGLTPYRAKKYRMVALGFVDLLRAKNCKDNEARYIVGDAYSLDSETIKSWRKELGKVNDPLMKSFRSQIANSTHWDDARVKKELKVAAGNFKLANKKKKQKK